MILNNDMIEITYRLNSCMNASEKYQKSLSEIKSSQKKKQKSRRKRKKKMKEKKLLV